MEFLKNVKLNHDERRDIDYVQDVKIIDKLPKINEEFEGCIVGSIDLIRVDIEERRQEDYDFYELELFDEKNYELDCELDNSADKKDYELYKIVAISK